MSQKQPKRANLESTVIVVFSCFPQTLIHPLIHPLTTLVNPHHFPLLSTDMALVFPTAGICVFAEICCVVEG